MTHKTRTGKNQWIGKNTAYKIWTDINTYVDNYTGTNMKEHDSEWYRLFFI